MKEVHSGDMDTIKYFRRRQFVCGPEYLQFEGWNKYKIATILYLSVHPDLPVYEANSANKTLTLLGYIIDPVHPEENEPEILDRMMSVLNKVDDVADCLLKMSGRFVLFVRIEAALFVFHDSAGLRQIVYCRDEKGNMWCASQAESLSERLGFIQDKEVLEFNDSTILQEKEVWLVNGRTPFKQISLLLPNHYLDLNLGKPIRFWPNKDGIPSLSLMDGMKMVNLILQNSIEAACRKFDLKMGISAGIDSRKTLAASKKVKDQLHAFTIENDLNGIESVDVKVPRRLLSRLGIPHEVLKKQTMEYHFRRLFESSATFARSMKGDLAYTFYLNFGPNVTILNGNVSETPQCYLWLPKSKINGKGLALITGLYHPFAIQEFEKWLQEAYPFSKNAGLDILGLFHWEQKMGRWAAATFAEYDIACETFTPYNNRLLNSYLFGIPKRYRQDRRLYIEHKQIKAMWPEILCVPINPKKGFVSNLIRIIRIKFVHNWISPWFPIISYIKYINAKIKLKK